MSGILFTMAYYMMDIPQLIRHWRGTPEDLIQNLGDPEMELGMENILQKSRAKRGRHILSLIPVLKMLAVY